MAANNKIDNYYMINMGKNNDAKNKISETCLQGA